MGTNGQLTRNRLERAALLSEELIGCLEDPGVPLSMCCLKAHRLALLMHDDVENLVVKGLIYGVDKDTQEVRHVASYSGDVRRQAYEIDISLLSVPDTRKVTEGLIEQAWHAESPGTVLPNDFVASAPISELERLGPEPVHPGFNVTVDEFNRYLREHIGWTSHRKVLARVRSWLHDYATRVNIRVQFADVIASILESYRAVVDSRLVDICPQALDMLSAAYQRLPGASAEERSQAVTTLRRVLKAFADAVYPSRPSAEGERKLDDGAFVNRLWAWAEENIQSDGKRGLVQAHLEKVGHWIDAVYASQNKGVHSTVAREEAERILLHTYLLLGDLIRLGEERASPPPS